MGRYTVNIIARESRVSTKPVIVPSRMIAYSTIARAKAFLRRAETTSGRSNRTVGNLSSTSITEREQLSGNVRFAIRLSRYNPARARTGRRFNVSYAKYVKCMKHPRRDAHIGGCAGRGAREDREVMGGQGLSRSFQPLVQGPSSPSALLPPLLHPRGHVKDDNLSDADCAGNIRHRPPVLRSRREERRGGGGKATWMATCKHGDVMASARCAVPGRLVLCVHTDVSLAHCSCRSRTVNQTLHPAAASQFGRGCRGGLPTASPLGSLYKGITIIRCLINPPHPSPPLRTRASAICLGRVYGARNPNAPRRRARRFPRSRAIASARRDPRAVVVSLRCNLPRAHRPSKLEST